MAAAKKNSPTTSTPWKSYPAETVKDTIRQFVHFSAKIVNSNTPAAGVRLSTEQKQDLPYLCVSTVGPSKVPLDYLKNAGAAATIAKNLDAVAKGTVLQAFTDVPSEDIDTYRVGLADAGTYYEAGTGMVGKRLRQIIVQDAEGNDIALTPLASSGFALLLQQRIEQEIHNSAPDTYRYRARGVLGIGGANPQNVGRHVRSLQRPLWYSAPAEDPELRKALAIHYRGISLSVPSALVLQYDRWRQDTLSAHGGVIPATAKNIDVEIAHLRRMIAAVLQRASAARTLLATHLDQLPSQKMVSPLVAADMRALLDPNERYAGWSFELARRIHVGILEKRIRVNGKLRNLGVGQRESHRWISIIEEALL